MVKANQIFAVVLPLILIAVLLPIGIGLIYSNPIVENRRTCLENNDISVIVNGSTSVNASSFNFNNDNSSISGVNIETQIIESKVITSGSDGSTYMFSDDLGDPVVNWIFLGSFRLNATKLLTDVGLQIAVPSSNISFHVYATTCESNNKPSIANLTDIGLFSEVYGVSIKKRIITLDVSDTLLDISTTFNQTFYLGILPHTPSSNMGWYYRPDTGTGSDNLDESKSYIYNTTSMNFIAMDGFWNEGSLDFVFNVTTSESYSYTLSANKTIRIDFDIPSGSYNKSLLYKFASSQSNHVSEINGTFDTNLTSSENNKLFTCNVWESDSFNETSFEVTIVVNVTVSEPITLAFQVCYLEVITTSNKVDSINLIIGLIPLFAALALIVYFIKSKMDD